MKNRRCFTSVWALALAGMMLLAGPALAQNQGGGQGSCPAGQGKELCTPGPGGTCAVNPPPKQVKQKCPALQRKGSQAAPGACSGNQPKTQANPPAASQ
ncbi:MAG: hypothetical protein ABSA09_08585 [Desulfobaccales bacterium]|jgi:hypothetical protein